MSSGPGSTPSAARLSVRSERVRQARRLLRRASRERTGTFLVEGPQAVREAVAAGVVGDVFTTPQGEDRQARLLADARDAGAVVHPVDDEALAVLAETVSPQGVVAVARLLDVALSAVVLARPHLVAVLAQVRDPGNAGSVVRCADAAGADAVVLTGASVDVHNGKAVRASAGSVFHLPLVTGVELGEAVDGLRGAGCTVLAADGAGDTVLDEALARGLLDGPAAWVFGSEAWGLPAADRALADAVVRVPLYGRAESLNLATAAALCLYASARAHRGQRAPT